MQVHLKNMHMYLCIYIYINDNFRTIHSEGKNGPCEIQSALRINWKLLSK